MTQLVIKVNDNLAARFKEISSKKFQGDDTLAFETAVKYLLSEEDRHMLRFEQIVKQIQDEIEEAGSVTDTDIDAYINAYRKKKALKGV